MEQTVYIDILFFVNFGMDFQCLFLTAKLLNRPFFLRRVILFSAMGALYACAVLFVVLPGILAFVADCAVCALMCVGALWQREEPLWRMLLPFALYFGVSFAVGGVISGMGALLSRLSLPIVSGGGGLSSAGFFLLAALGGALTFFWGRVCQRRAGGKRVALTLELDGQRITVQGMVDTANSLRDPIGGKPVVLLKKTATVSLFLRELMEAAEHHEAVTALSEDVARRLRWIPAETAVGNGLLLAVQPDLALLDVGGGAVAVDVLVAPVPLKGVEDTACDALLPPGLL